MRYLALGILLLTGCGPEPYLEEGMYTVQLVETSNSCGWANGDTGTMYWDIVRVGKHYGITHMSNLETIACTQSSEDYDIYCDKDKDVWSQGWEFHVVQDVVMEPQEDSFTGTFAVTFSWGVNESCGQEAVIDGELQQAFPNR